MINLTAVMSLATTLFIVANPIGNSPAILTVVKDYDLPQQRKILMREGFIALILALFFQYLGDYFLDLLHLKNYTIAFCGGILLFMVALSLIFPQEPQVSRSASKTIPFLVPIATPLLAGPGLLTIIMVYGSQEDNPLTVTLAILVCWIGVSLVLYITPYMQRVIGKTGIHALEQIMGLVLALISTDMFVTGMYLFIHSLK